MGVERASTRAQISGQRGNRSQGSRGRSPSRKWSSPRLSALKFRIFRIFQIDFSRAMFLFWGLTGEDCMGAQWHLHEAVRRRDRSGWCRVPGGMVSKWSISTRGARRARKLPPPHVTTVTHLTPLTSWLRPPQSVKCVSEPLNSCNSCLPFVPIRVIRVYRWLRLFSRFPVQTVPVFRLE